MAIQLALCMLTCALTVAATFDAAANDNIAIYWGQNSVNAAGGNGGQQRLSFYCANSDIDIFPLAFLNLITNPTVNFASASDRCTPIPNTSLLNCPEIAEDITKCQNTYGKKIILSIGGATYTEGGFASPADAISSANTIWAMFGPPQTNSNAPRPFNSASVDGFDFDLESAAPAHMYDFAKRLRSLMDFDAAATGRKYLLTAAPQCPYPDVADDAMLNSDIAFDAVFVQYYNNYCGVNSFVAPPEAGGNAVQDRFNFDAWDAWAQRSAANRNVRVFLGVPGGPSAAGSGYLPASALSPIISYCQRFASFGGVMAWDVSQVYANTGFLDGIVSALRGSGGAASSAVVDSAPPAPTAGTPASPPPGGQGAAVAAQSLLGMGPSTLRTVVTPAGAPGVRETSPPSPGAPKIKQLGSTPGATGIPAGSDGPNAQGDATLPGSSPPAVAPPAAVSQQQEQQEQQQQQQQQQQGEAASTPPTQPALVHHWGQCGGRDWRGGTVCEAPWRCVVYSEWYSDCR